MGLLAQGFLFKHRVGVDLREGQENSTTPCTQSVFLTHAARNLLNVFLSLSNAFLVGCLSVYTSHLHFKNNTSTKD